MKKFRFLMCLSVIIMIMLGIFSFSCSATEGDSDFSVSSVSAVNASEGTTVKWKRCKGAEGYIIYRAEGNGKFKKLTELPADAFSYEDTTVSSGKSYRYKAVPLKASAEGGCKAVASITYLSVPSRLRASNNHDGVKITWKKTIGADSYTIYRRLPSETSWKHAGFAKDTDHFVDKKVKNSDRYIYTVRAKLGKEASSYYNENGVSAFFIEAPSIKSISNTSEGIRISWQKVSGAKSYIVYRRTSGASWTRIAQLNSKTLKYTDTEIQPLKGYAYTVRAVRGDEISGFYPGLSYRYIPVIKVTSTKNEAEGILVTWKKSPYATGYKLYRKDEANTKWKRIATFQGRSSLSYTDKKVSSTKQYTYTVIAMNGEYQSTFDNVGKTATFVAPPKNVSFSISGLKNTVRWDKVTGATNYYIYRRTKAESEWTKLARVDDTSSYVDSKADMSVTYYYCVRAGINSKYFSTYSKEVKSGNIDPNKKMVALTYDDGPGDASTTRILNVLEKYNAKATFFVVGSRVDSYSYNLVRAHNLGCQIGNHTYSHINLPSYSDSSIRNEISKTDAVVKKYTGVTPTIARAPGGSTNQRARNAAGKPFIQWSIDTRDWEHRNASRTISIIKNNVRDGSIILMHDIHAPTASASETIIPWLLDQGYQLVTVSELMRYRGIEMHSGGIYYNAYK